MKKLLTIILFVSVLVLSAFGAQVMGAGATVHGMRAVVRQLPGTFVMAGEGMYLLAWPQGSSYAYTVIASDGAGVDWNSLKVATTTAAELTAALMERGWQMVSAKALPQSLQAALSGPSVYAILNTMAGSLPSVLVLPVMVLPTPQPHY